MPSYQPTNEAGVSTYELMDDAAPRAGWSERTALKVALDFIYEEGAVTVSRFRDYLNTRVEEEEQQ